MIAYMDSWFYQAHLMIAYMEIHDYDAHTMNIYFMRVGDMKAAIVWFLMEETSSDLTVGWEHCTNIALDDW